MTISARNLLGSSGAAALDVAASGEELDLAAILGPCESGMEVPGLRQRYVGVLRAKRLDVAIADARLASERKLLVASRGFLVEQLDRYY